MQKRLNLDDNDMIEKRCNVQRCPFIIVF